MKKELKMFLITERNESQSDEDYHFDLDQEEIEESEHVNEYTYVIRAESIEAVKDILIKRCKEIGGEFEGPLEFEKHWNHEYCSDLYLDVDYREYWDCEEEHRTGNISITIQNLEEAIELGEEIIKDVSY